MLDHHEGTQCSETEIYKFYNKTFDSILKVAHLLKDVVPGNLCFVKYKSKCCVYDLELEAIFYKKKWIHIPKDKLIIA